MRLAHSDCSNWTSRLTERDAFIGLAFENIEESPDVNHVVGDRIKLSGRMRGDAEANFANLDTDIAWDLDFCVVDIKLTLPCYTGSVTVQVVVLEPGHATPSRLQALPPRNALAITTRYKMNPEMKDALIKVPQVTLGFWVIKILATTLGETGGDSISISMNLGYLVGTAIFMALFVLAVVFQIRAKKFQPFIYWTAIVASTTVGTTLADFADRSLGIGYLGGSTLLAILLVSTLFIWHRTLGTISVGSIHTPKAETFYWLTIMFSQTLGTALGDWTADSAGLGYVGAAYIFSGGLALVTAAYFFTKVSHTVLFWSAFVLTRPLGAVVGDFLDKPLAQGGLEFSRYTATAVLLVAIVILIIVLPQRAATKSH